MKAELLKKLRRKYAKRYFITKASDGWRVWFGDHYCNYWLALNFEEARDMVKEAIMRDIEHYLRVKREKMGKKNGIRYYPWIFLLFFTISSNAQTKQQVLAEIKRQNIPHPEIVLAQARLESGNFKSQSYYDTHNLFGIKEKGKYVHYGNWRKSVSDYKKKISKRYKEGNYYTFLQRIGYASDKQYINKLKSCVK